jgi:predicted NBD/HSP70 family sugar kinase
VLQQFEGIRRPALVTDLEAEEDLKGGRVRNRRRVIDLLRQNGALSQAVLADLTGLSRATVSSLVSELRQYGLVVNAEVRPDQPRAGRPPSSVALGPSLGVGVGINVTADTIHVGVGNVGLEVLAERVVRPEEFRIGGDVAASLDLAAKTVAEVLADGGIAPSQVIGGALGVAGPIDIRDGSVRPTSYLPAWIGQRPAAALGHLVDFPVVLENDGSLSAFAEAVSGAVTGAAQVLYVEAPGPVGSGLIINGRVYRGAYGGAGEIAHMIFETGGELCFCGRRGCLAMVIDPGKLVREVAAGHRRVMAPSEFDPDALEAPGIGMDQRLELIARWVAAGDPIAARVMGDAGRVLGLVVGNVCNILNPERVVVGGIGPRAGEAFMEPFTRGVHDHTKVLPGWPVPIVLSHWGDRAELIGGIALGIRGEDERLAGRLYRLVEQGLRGRPAPQAAAQG